VVIWVGRAEARAFVKLIPVRRCVMHCKATLSQKIPNVNLRLQGRLSLTIMQKSV
jgi:hypothetical protein